MRDTNLQDLSNRQLAVFRLDVGQDPARSQIHLAWTNSRDNQAVDWAFIGLLRKPTSELKRREVLGAGRRRLLDAFAVPQYVPDSINLLVGPAELQRISHLDHADLMMIAVTLGYGRWTRKHLEPDSARYGFIVQAPVHPIIVFMDRSGEAEAMSVVNMNPDRYLEKEESLAYDHVVLCPRTIPEWKGRVSQKMVDIAFAPWLSAGDEEKSNWEAFGAYADAIALERERRDRQLVELFVREVALDLDDPIVTFGEVDLRREAVGVPATFRRGSLEEMRRLMYALRLHEIACEEHRIETMTAATFEQEAELKEYKRDPAEHLDWRVPAPMFVSTEFGNERAFICRRERMRDAHLEIATRIVDNFGPSSSAPRYITTNRESGIKPGAGYLDFSWKAEELLASSAHERIDARARLTAFLEQAGLRPSGIEHLLDLTAS